jgi:hypothetical protein
MSLVSLVVALVGATTGCGGASTHNADDGGTPDSSLPIDAAGDNDGGNIDSSVPVDSGPFAPTMLSLVAGGLGGPGAADGIGAAARFDGPYSMTGDGAGNLYIADSNNHAIRKLVIATGEVTTLAGALGKAGSADGIGGAARFSAPEGIAIDTTGNLYVTDTGNHTIRKVVIATGDVSTIAGTAGQSGSADGTGALARFYAPYGLTRAAGNLFVVDSLNHTVRKVVISTGVVTTLAGSAGTSGSADGIGAAARFYSPRAISTDGAGILYVSDTLNHTIRKLIIVTAGVTTIAGTAGQSGGTDAAGANARFNAPNGVLVDGAGNLIIADGNNNTIRKLVLATGDVTTVAGTAMQAGSIDGTGSAARFDLPRGLVLDGAGALYVGDYRNHSIRKIVLATGDVTTLAGTASKLGSTDATGAAARFYAPCGVVGDASGNVYVGDFYNHTIRKVVLASGAVTTLAGAAGAVGSADALGGSARFSNPCGITSDGAGNLFVTDFSNHTIRKVVVATGAVTTLAGTANMSGTTDATGAAARFTFPLAVAIDGANLYVADAGNHAIRKVVVATGEVTTLAGMPGVPGTSDGTGAAAGFGAPQGLVADGAGHLYVADSGNSTIRKVVIATGEVTTVAGTAGQTGTSDGTGAAARFNRPFHLTYAEGMLYVADYNNHTLRKVDVASGAVTTLAGVVGVKRLTPGALPGELSFPTGVTMTPASELVVTSENSILVVQ